MSVWGDLLAEGQVVVVAVQVIELEGGVLAGAEAVEVQGLLDGGGGNEGVVSCGLVDVVAVVVVVLVVVVVVGTESTSCEAEHAFGLESSFLGLCQHF